MNTFNKVWILPDDALIYEKGNTAYVLKNHLRVMLEEDYLSLEKHNAISRHSEGARSATEESKGALRSFVPLRGTQDDKTHALASKIIKEIVLPELQREVNEDKNFAPLRQVYSGMLLATWFKRTLKQSLLGQIYANKAKVKGVDQDPKTNEEIYRQYLRAYKKGVFNFIKEDTDRLTNETIPRKYFSGGLQGYVAPGSVRITYDSAMGKAQELKDMPDDDMAQIALLENRAVGNNDAAMMGLQEAADKILTDQGLANIHPNVEGILKELGVNNELNAGKIQDLEFAMYGVIALYLQNQNPSIGRFMDTLVQGIIERVNRVYDAYTHMFGGFYKARAWEQYTLLYSFLKRIRLQLLPHPNMGDTSKIREDIESLMKKQGDQKEIDLYQVKDGKVVVVGDFKTQYLYATSLEHQVQLIQGEYELQDYIIVTQSLGGLLGGNLMTGQAEKLGDKSYRISVSNAFDRMRQAFITFHESMHIFLEKHGLYFKWSPSDIASDTYLDMLRNLVQDYTIEKETRERFSNEFASLVGVSRDQNLTGLFQMGLNVDPLELTMLAITSKAAVSLYPQLSDSRSAKVIPNALQFDGMNNVIQELDSLNIHSSRADFQRAVLHIHEIITGDALAHFEQGRLVVDQKKVSDFVDEVDQAWAPILGKLSNRDEAMNTNMARRIVLVGALAAFAVKAASTPSLAFSNKNLDERIKRLEQEIENMTSDKPEVDKFYNYEYDYLGSKIRTKVHILSINPKLENNQILQIVVEDVSNSPHHGQRMTLEYVPDRQIFPNGMTPDRAMIDFRNLNIQIKKTLTPEELKRFADMFKNGEFVFNVTQSSDTFETVKQELEGIFGFSTDPLAEKYLERLEKITSAQGLKALRQLAAEAFNDDEADFKWKGLRDIAYPPLSAMQPSIFDDVKGELERLFTLEPQAVDLLDTLEKIKAGDAKALHDLAEEAYKRFGWKALDDIVQKTAIGSSQRGTLDRLKRSPGFTPVIGQPPKITPIRDIKGFLGINQKGDPAMRGGIDLNSANLNLVIKRDGNGVPLPLAQQDLAQLSNIQGLDPVILSIKPASQTALFSQLQVSQ